MPEGRPRVKVIVASLALFVLFYFMGYYMLNPILRTLHAEGLIPGKSEVEWRFNAGLIATLLQGTGLVLSFVWGVLADKVGRRPVIFTLGVIMGLGLLLVSQARSYAELLAYFIAFGVGYVGVGPAIYAFISDALPSESRGRGYASYYVSSVLAMILGLIVAGVLLPWRTAYMLAGLLTLVFSVLLFYSSRGIFIGYSEKGAREARRYSLRESLPSLRKKSVLLVLLMIIPWTIPWGMLSIWSIDYISTKWGVSTGTASLIIAAATASIALGHIVGGTLSDRLAGKGDYTGRTKVSLLGVVVGYVSMMLMVTYPYPYGSTNFKDLLVPSALAVGGMMFTTFAYPNINTVLSEVVVPEHRGTVFAVYSVLNNLGWTLGPTVYTLLLKAFSGVYADQVSAMTAAASTIVSLWLIPALCWLLLHRVYPKEKI
ncbi:MFS transporter [Thermofilum pendens]|uniref:Major facilitator superfamily MFS_1 n=1 Tax=Thermofilum pendens (strain DSM 2475 / Hrk 5) TaxID=368408 RepID=A1RW34_THEPD|nr:MFS transporter [Thermofilum pendens]ABL77414.1 major facilitator superfamily MFS_1 [Thermofilum pendens Hrk 5]